MLANVVIGMCVAMPPVFRLGYLRLEMSADSDMNLAEGCGVFWVVEALFSPAKFFDDHRHNFPLDLQRLNCAGVGSETTYLRWGGCSVVFCAETSCP